LFEVFFSNQAKKFIDNCEPTLRDRLKILFKVLADAPVPAKDFDTRKLEGTEDCYRIRLSSYRILYQARFHERQVHVLKIERRSETTYG